MHLFNKIKAVHKTEAQVIYDDHFLYVSFTCFDEGGTRISQTLKRDIVFWESDAVSIVLDPQARKSNGFLFGVTAAFFEVVFTVERARMPRLVSIIDCNLWAILASMPNTIDCFSQPRIQAAIYG